MDHADRSNQDQSAPVPQDESQKKHGDVLDPVIPRGADQKAGAQEPRGGDGTKDGQKS